MGTRSMIGILNEDLGTVEASYCHYDGYLEGVGNTLLDNYNTDETANKVATGGYLSSLTPDYEASKEASVNDDPSELFYSKDVYEKADNWGAEYLYLWDGTQWLVNKVYGEEAGFKPLATYMQRAA